MAAHGVARSTQDLDLLALDPACLAPGTWQPLKARGVSADIRHGDETDPLRGVVHLAAGTALVDVIVGRSGWQAGVLERATAKPIDGTVVPVATRRDLIVLKLYAGGMQDAWDIEQLLGVGDRPALVRDVAAALPDLPDHARQLWARIVGPR